MRTIEVTGQLEGHAVRAVWRDGRLDGDAALVATIEGMLAGGGRLSIPGVVAGVATLDLAKELLVQATLCCACDASPPLKLKGGFAHSVPAASGADVDY